jgi:hypothetical protein
MNDNDMENFRFENVRHGNLSNTVHITTPPSMVSPPGRRRSRVSELPPTSGLKGNDGGTLAAGSLQRGAVQGEIPGPLGWKGGVGLNLHLLNTPCFGAPVRKRAEAPKKNTTTQIQHT